MVRKASRGRGFHQVEVEEELRSLVLGKGNQRWHKKDQ
jgi:hypothetical protein